VTDDYWRFVKWARSAGLVIARTSVAHAVAGSDGDYWSKPNRETIFECIYELMHEAMPRKYPRFL